MNKKTLLNIASVVLALLVWQLAAMRVGRSFLLSSPVEVLERLATIWREPGFGSTVLLSSLRILSGFLIAFAAGVVLGALAAAFPVVELILRPYVVTVKTVPVVSFIILCLLWMDYNGLTVFISFLVAFPFIYSNVRQGIKSTDEKMKEMAKLYRVPWYRRMLYIYIPAVKPYLISAVGVAGGTVWKAGVSAEVIGIIDGSIGEKLYMAKVNFLNADLLCWTIVIILLSIIMEKLFVFLLQLFFRGVCRL